MRVAHLFAPAAFGGLERVVHSLAAGQKNEDYDVSVIALLERGRPEPPIVEDLRRVGVRVLPLSLPHRSYPEQRRSLIDLCRDHDPQVLHSHGYLSDVLAASLGRRFSAARVTTVHGFTGGGTRNRMYEWIQRRSFHRFDAVVAVSRKLGQQLKFRGSASRLTVVQNAWSPGRPALPRESAQAEFRLSSDAFNVGWIGRLTREKGADILVDALPLLRDLPVHVSFIGEGSEREALTLKAAKLGVGARVSWHGPVTDAGWLVRAFDLLVISSRTEGSPITLFEAMDAGVPVVATAVGGVPDIVSTNEGILVQPEDPAALAAAVKRVHDRPAEASDRANRARARLASEFAAQPWIRRYGQVYQTAISARK